MKRRIFIILFVLLTNFIQAATIYIYVHNVNGNLIPNSYVKFYNGSWNLINTGYTNSSGMVEFYGLDYGTYNYEVFYTGDAQEFWGSEENISLQSPTLTSNFTRYWPFRYSYNTPPSSVYTNNPVAFDITVKNNVSFSRNVKVELWVDRNQSPSWDFHQTSSSQSISSNGTKTYNFNFTPTSSGTYYWKMHVLTYNDGSGGYIVTDSYSWTSAFAAYDQEGDLDIYVKNVNGNYVENAYVKLYDEYWNFEDDDYTNSSGRADFDNLEYGLYHYEVFYTGDVQEFWGGDENINVNSSSETETFTRNWPYRYSYDEPPTTVDLYSQATYEITVKNNLSFSRNVKVELWVDRDQSSSWDFHQTSSYQSISSNGTKTYAFDFTPTVSGTYYWKMRVLSYNDGAGNYIVTDSYLWSFSFEAVNNQPFPLNEGAIIYHSYSDYDAWDSKLFMYDFTNGTKTELSTNWNIDHEMNAHISPDGSKIVFMGDDSGEPRHWDIYIWDIGSNNAPINLTSSNNLRDEDPKFSPDGTNIVFKQEGDIKVMDLSGNIINEITNDGYTIEESMPYYKSNGQEIIYAKGAGANSDVYSININGSNNTALYDVSGVTEYYPILRNNSSFFYSRWISSSNHNDQIYLGDFYGNSSSLSINDLTSNNSDAYPVNSDYLFFSSTRSGGLGGYDLYFGQLSTGEVWNLNDFGINSSLEDLGVCYVSEIPSPPSSPSAILANTISTNQIDISWSNVSNEDGYKIYRATSSGGSYSQIGTTGANVTSYSNTGLNSNMLFCYKVKAYNSAGDSDFSTYDCATTFNNVPVNDDCSNATLISEVVDLAFNTTDATVSGIQPSCGGSSAPIDIWYSYNATHTGLALFDLCGSSYDTRLAIWTDCGTTELACNDDNGPSCSGLQSSIEMPVTIGTTYYIQVGGYNLNSGQGDLSIQVDPLIVLSLRVFLEGAFNGTCLNTNLVSTIPLSQPFNKSPWNYNGSESVPNLPNNNIVDWVLIELRDASSASSALSNTVIERQAAFLLNDGTVVGLDGSSDLQFEATYSQNLFVVVWHRNHLGIISSQALTDVGGIYSYDFTISADRALGATSAQKELAPGIWGMIGSDGDASGVVNVLDKDLWSIQAGESGYKASDFNLNGQIENSDKNDIWVNSDGYSSQIPTGSGFSCGDQFVDTRDSQSYNTVQIGTQCWMAENINIGSMINGSEEQADNNIFEKYCYNNTVSNCDTYGGLYQWDEMMQYEITIGTQGICPDDWHIPTDEEWKILEGTVDGQFGVGDPEWNGTAWRGFDVGKHLKSSNGWDSNGNGDNSSGFSALPSGHTNDGVFYNLGSWTNLWTSNGNSGTFGWHYNLNSDYDLEARYSYVSSLDGFAVRCLNNDIFPTWSCGDDLIDGRDSQTYTTVEIGSQCWMAENLNIGIRIDGTNNMNDNSTIEKYCYDDNTSNCDTYGGLYQWNEMMQYITTEGTQGICPTGWHLPIDAEWKILEGTVDSQYGVGNPIWDNTGLRGFDASKNLKSTSGWYNDDNGLDLFNFSLLPAGARYATGVFNALIGNSLIWSSSEENGSDAWRRYIHYDEYGVNRGANPKTNGFSVRCIHD